MKNAYHLFGGSESTTVQVSPIGNTIQAAHIRHTPSFLRCDWDELCIILRFLVCISSEVRWKMPAGETLICVWSGVHFLFFMADTAFSRLN